jgi:hypothetical protein
LSDIASSLGRPVYTGLKKMKDDDDPFIVLTEAKISICYIPVWARYSPLQTRVKAHAMTLSP